jgi:hypothetical protein
MKVCMQLVALVMAACLSTFPLQTAQAQEPGWGLLIKSPHVGIVYLYITNDGFALVVKETGAKFVTHAPDWKLVMYNDKTQVYYVERLQDLQNVTNSRGKKVSEVAKRATVQNAKAGKTEVIAGLPATQYLINTYSPDGGERQAEVWITKSITPPVQLHKTFEKIFNIDMSSGSFPKGMPLRIKVSDDAGKRDTLYDTLNCQHQMIHTASFSYPKNYKPVDSELAVLMDEKSRQKMESILDDSDDISTLLGSAGSSGTAGKGQGQGGTRPLVNNAAYARGGTAPNYPQRAPGSAYAASPRPAVNSARPAAAVPTQQPKKQSGDWWSNMFNSLGK